MKDWKSIFFKEFLKSKPIYLQIEEQVIEGIKNGYLHTGQLMPSTRDLARQLSVHPKTVRKAYERLTAKDWLYSIERQGTYVKNKQSVLTDVPEKERLPSLNHINLNDDFPSLLAGPTKQLVSTYRRYFTRNARLGNPVFDNTRGYLPLRDSLRIMLAEERGLLVHPDQLCLTQGHRLPLLLSAQILQRRKGKAVMSNPGNPVIQNVFNQAGTDVITVSADAEGMNVEELALLCERHEITSVYISPRCQFPNTSVLSPKRRKALVKLAQRYSFIILEADYEHEFWYDHRPYEPLYAQFSGTEIIHFTNLSKMTPSLYLVGLVIGPQWFIRQLDERIKNQHNILLEQALNELLKERMIRLYGEKLKRSYTLKRDRIARLLHHYKTHLDFNKPAAGLAYWLRPDRAPDYDQFIDQLKKNSMYLAHPACYALMKRQPTGIRLGFGSIRLEDLEKFLHILIPHISR